jgi:single-strand DNA-binding protein
VRNTVEISIAGNLTEAPELRFGPSGTAIARFTVAVNHRYLDKASNEWKDSEPAFYRCSAFGQLAENLAESFEKGDRVIVLGRQEYRTWADKDSGEKRGAFQVVADEVGGSAAWATLKMTKTSKRRDDVPPSDEWASASKTRPAPAQSGGWGSPADAWGTGNGAPAEEPPF